MKAKLTLTSRDIVHFLFHSLSHFLHVLPFSVTCYGVLLKMPFYLEFCFAILSVQRYLEFFFYLGCLSLCHLLPGILFYGGCHSLNQFLPRKSLPLSSVSWDSISLSNHVFYLQFCFFPLGCHFLCLQFTYSSIFF